MLPNAGTYRAKLNGQMVVYETDKGALCVAVPTMLLNSETPWAGKSTQTLVKSDGTVNTKCLDMLKKIFVGWDGLDPFSLMYEDAAKQEGAREWPDAEFEIVGEHQTADDPESGEPYQYFSVNRQVRRRHEHLDTI